MKECKKCHKIKDESEFHKTKYTKDGLKPECKECRSEYAKNVRKEKNKNKPKKEIKKFLKVKIFKPIKEKKCDGCLKIKLICYFEYRKSSGVYFNFCKECIKFKQNEYAKNNRKNISNREREYYKNENNRKRRSELRKQREKQRRLNDPEYNLRRILKTNVYSALKLYTKKGKTKSCIKYGIVLSDIYSKIGPRPSKNYHLDHIIPASLFDLNNEEHIKLAYSPENLQWLSGSENIKKSDNILDYVYCSLKLIKILKIIDKYEVNNEQ